MASILSAGTTNSTALNLTADTSGSLILASNNNVTAVTIATNQNVTFANNATFPTTIGVGGATPSASGSGISFPASQSASTNANTLDDYEEGTFTPILAFGGNSVGITYSGNNGIYTKIGRNVYFSFGIALSNKGSSTGSATIGGFPYASGTGKSYREEGTRCGQYAGINSDFSLWVQNNTTSFLILSPSAGSALTDANFTNSSSPFVCGYYVTDN
jgi:hypothetical protein